MRSQPPAGRRPTHPDDTVVLGEMFRVYNLDDDDPPTAPVAPTTPVAPLKPPTFRINHLWVKYKSPNGDSVNALAGVSLDIRPGLMAVVGVSGSGKSTLLHVLSGQARPTGGAVSLNGKPVPFDDEWALDRYRRDRVNLVPQAPHLVDMPAVDNVALPLWARGEKTRPARDKAWDALERFGIGRLADRRPAQLSGGEKQRVLLARALAARPEVVLADEPTAALDHASAKLAMRQLRVLVNEGIPVVVVTHDLTIADECDVVTELRDGRLVVPPQ